MKSEIRVTLYAHDPLPALRLLDAGDVAVCDITGDTAALPGRVAALRPHALVLYDPVGDTASLIKAIAAALPACPPRLIFRAQAVEGADACLPDDLAACVAQVMAAPCGALALPSLPARMACAERLLDGIGMSVRLRGRPMLAQGAAWLSTVPPPAPTLQEGLYFHLARQAGVQPAAVERRIRSAIESAWLHGDLPAQNALMGLSVSPERGKPTNGELLYRLAERICQLLYP